MTDASPKNLRKFLESDDPAIIGMGLSMAKGSGDASREVLGMILGLYMFHDDKNIRALSKTAFTKLAPSDSKEIVRKYWQAEYRNQPWVWEGGWMKNMFSELELAGIKTHPILESAQEKYINELQGQKESLQPGDWPGGEGFYPVLQLREAAANTLDAMGWEPDTTELNVSYLLAKSDVDALAK